MHMLFGYILPVAGLALLIVGHALQLHSRLALLLASGLNLLGVATLTGAKTPNVIWVALFAATGIALLLVGVALDRDYDLLLGRYFTTLGRVLILATTIWWLGAVILTF